jgi:hypothetical protein
MRIAPQTGPVSRSERIRVVVCVEQTEGVAASRWRQSFSNNGRQTASEESRLECQREVSVRVELEYRGRVG